MGEKTRTQKAKFNMFFSLLQQGIAFICGLIVPKMMLNAFGSDAYGTTTSIATFLAYITLLEGGVGAVTRSALYKALAGKSNEQVSAVITETKSFFRKIAIAFILYVLIVACFYNQISHDSVFDFWYTFGLIIVIALSTFAEYFIGISYTLLLQADQMNYVVVIFKIITTILNTICIVVLTSLRCDILTVKLLSGILFMIRPILLSVYVKKRYQLTEIHQTEKLLTNKKTAIGQHIAYALHNNTDITVLTIFENSAIVSVYSVYNMVIAQLQSVLSSFSSGMEAVFGNMYANKEEQNLQRTFGYYETLISLLSVTFFSATAVLITPFVRIYTSGLDDAPYENQLFAIMLIIATMLYVLRGPYHQMIIASGRFKETRMAAYGEVIINIISSIVLVIKFGIVGVAIGTVLATMFRFIFYVSYLSKHILHRPVILWIKRIVTNGVLFGSICIIGFFIVSKMPVTNYLEWAIAGIVITLFAGILALLTNLVLYKNDLLAIIHKGFGKVRS